MHHVPPIKTVPGLTTELLAWQESGAGMTVHACNSPAQGCIVGDEMGLGKTLQTIVACRVPSKEPRHHHAFNLVITTKTCVPQWRDEILMHFDKVRTMLGPSDLVDSLQDHQSRVIILKGSRWSAIELLDAKVDWVITTYQQVQSQHRQAKQYRAFFDLAAEIGLPDAIRKQKNNRTPRRPQLSLFSSLYRELERPINHLILDEAQLVKRPDGMTHLAIKELYYRKAILLSGTFLANRWSDVYGLVDYLKGHPFESFADFMSVFGLSRFDEGYGRPPVSRQRRLIRFLQAFTFARPSSLLDLPGMKTNMVRFPLDAAAAERVIFYTKRFYDLLRDSRLEGNKQLAAACRRKALMSALRAQQYAANRVLIGPKMTEDEVLIKSAIAKLKAMLKAEGVDRDNAALVMKTILTAVKARTVPRARADHPAPREKDSEDLDYDDKVGVTEPLGAYHDSDSSEDESVSLKARQKNAHIQWRKAVSKLSSPDLLSPRVSAVVDTYNGIKRADPSGKVVIFSRFLKFLDLVEEALLRQKTPCLRFDGTKDDDERLHIRAVFANLGKTEPILITAGAGGAGMNLTAGTHLIQTECWWNGNEERQAYFRLHRKGQLKVVTLWLLQAQNSVIDEAIQQARDRKMNFNALFMQYLRFPDDREVVIPPIDRHYP